MYSSIGRPYQNSREATTQYVGKACLLVTLSFGGYTHPSTFYVCKLLQLPGSLHFLRWVLLSLTLSFSGCCASLPCTRHQPQPAGCPGGGGGRSPQLLLPGSLHPSQERPF
jgi:hypothetical protein